MKNDPMPQPLAEETDGMLPARTCCASSRYETMKAAEKFHRLQAHPHLQAEAIADHYSKLAATSMELRKLVEMRRHHGGSPEMDRCIERLAQEFVDHHRADFGIELSWHNANKSIRGRQRDETMSGLDGLGWPNPKDEPRTSRERAALGPSDATDCSPSSADCSVCDWQQEEDGQWETDCSETFEFNEGGPKANGFEWCPYCGKKLTETAYSDPENS